MSGIVGIFNRDGAPVDRELLTRMTDSLAYRGPDRTGIWIDGPIGFGHTLLATTSEHQREEQPCSFDSEVWIVADARVDDRDRLKRELIGKGRHEVENATDAELILHAYHVWGEDCVDHLLGDLSFAIWDGDAKKLFCARDQFGLKLFYYAGLKNGLIFSNDLECLRGNPGTTNRLNDLAIADFLLFGFNQELATTTFVDIQRLPPAHTLSVTNQSLHISRYWSLPIEDEIRYSRAQDYVENFKELLGEAVSDRIRNPQIAIFLSGGLDSSTIAAAAQRLLAEDGSSSRLRGYTVVFEHLIPDDEGRFAQLTAKKLGIEIRIINVDNTQLFDLQTHPGFRTTEPFYWPLLDNEYESWVEVSLYSRVVFFGEDGDALLHPASVLEMLKKTGFLRTTADLLVYLLRYRRRPPFGLGLYERLNGLIGNRSDPTRRDLYPPWLSKEFEHRLDLRSRWENEKSRTHSKFEVARATAYDRLRSPFWQNFIERVDMGVTRVPVEAWFPFLDLRLMRFLLALPSLPWCISKELLREAGRGMLPEPVRLRPKMPVVADTVHVLVSRDSPDNLISLDPVFGLERYIDANKVPSVVGGGYSVNETWLHLRPWSLNSWLFTLDHAAKS